MRHTLQRLAPILVLCLACGLAYWPGLGGSFLLDDFANLVENPSLRVGFDDDAGAWWRAIWSSPAGGLQRPLTMATFALDHALWDLDPGAWKRTNLLIHFGNAVLGFFVLHRLFSVAWPGFSTRGKLVASTMVALAWAVHPLQVSSVFYLVQRMELLAHSFVLLSLLAYLAGRVRIQGGSRSGWLLVVLAGLLALIGAGAKETALVAPLLALACELILFHFGAATDQDRRLLKILSAIGGLALVLVVVLLVVLYGNEEAFAGREFSATERVLTHFRLLPLYLGWILTPIPTAYVFYYDWIGPSKGLLGPWTTLGGLALLIGLAAAAWSFRRKLPLFALGLAWFFLFHLPTAGPVPLELVFEHRNYGASLAVLLALAGVAVPVLRSSARLVFPVVALATGFIVLSLFGTALRSWEWGDEFRLAGNLASRAKQSARAQHNFGVTLFRMVGPNTEDPLFFLGRNSLVVASRLPFARPQSPAVLITVYGRAGMEADSQWWGDLERLVYERPLDHHTVDALLMLSGCAVSQGCSLDDQRLQALLAQVTQRAAARYPDLKLAYADFALVRMEDPDLAVRLVEGAIADATRSPHIRANAALLLLRAGNIEQALSELEAAEALDRTGEFASLNQLTRRSLDAHLASEADTEGSSGEP